MSDEVRIFQPCKNPMQSGRAKSHGWFVAFKPGADSSAKDALMGWNATQDMRQELNLRFPTLEAAVAYVTQQKWTYTIEASEKKPTFSPKSYADNFTLGRLR